MGSVSIANLRITQAHLPGYYYLLLVGLVTASVAVSVNLLRMCKAHVDVY